MSLTEQLRAEDSFDRLNPERKQDVKKCQISQNRTLEWLCNGVSTMYYALTAPIHTEGHSPTLSSFAYELGEEEMLELGKKMVALCQYEIHARDITQLGITIEKHCPLLPNRHDFFSEVAGSYLNACIQRCKDKDISIHLEGLRAAPYYIGQENKGKNIVVRGNVGWDAGHSMESGHIEIYGNGTVNLGAGMRGGTLIIHGEIDEGLGSSMLGGLILLKSMPETDDFGCLMKGGTIRVEGGTEEELRKLLEPQQRDPNYRRGGDIYWKDKPIIVNGTLIPKGWRKSK